MNECRNLIREILLNQRAVLFDLRQQTPLAKFDVEVICFASGKQFFTTYDIRQHFDKTTPQQIYNCLKKLIKLDMVENFSITEQRKIYSVTEKGICYLNDYYTGIEKALDN